MLLEGPAPAADHAEPVYACPACQDRGFIYRQLPTEDPMHGQAAPCACRRRRMAETLPARIERAWTRAGVPRHLRDLRLETHPNVVDSSNPGLLARLQAADFRRAWWLFWGATSRGKSGLAVGYARAFLEATGESVVWRTVPDLLGELRASYDQAEGAPTEAELLYSYRTAGLLVLDDVGAERQPTEWGLERLYQVIAGRHAEERPMVLTTELADLNAWLGPRLCYRILEMCGPEGVVEVGGRNLRVRGQR